MDSMLSSDPERSWFLTAKASLISATSPSLTSASTSFWMTRRFPFPARRSFASIDRITGSRSGCCLNPLACSAAATFARLSRISIRQKDCGYAIGDNQRRQMSGCGARTATGSLKAVFESSDVERFAWVLGGLGGEVENMSLFAPVVRQVLAQSQELCRRELDRLTALKQRAHNIRRQIGQSNEGG